jgi:predicted phosphodiesterase
MKIGLISDVHANVVVLKAVLEDMGKVDAILCAGDIVGYKPYPNETMESRSRNTRSSASGAITTTR